MSGRRRAVVTVEQLMYSARLRGPARVVTPVLRALGTPWQFDARRSAFVVPLDRVDDLVAALEEAGVVVEEMLPGVTR